MLRNIIVVVMPLLCVLEGYSQQKLLLKNGQVVDVENATILPDMDVLIVGDKIEKIGHRLDSLETIPNSIDVEGRYIMPGLIDMHVHLPGTDSLDIPLQDFFRMSLTAGVTSLRCMRGNAMQLQLRDSIMKGYIIAPSLYVASPPFREKDIPVDSLYDKVKQYKDSGYLYIKYLHHTTAGYYDSLAHICKELEIPLVGHMPKEGLAVALKNHPLTVEHLDAFEKQLLANSSLLRKQLKQFADSGLYVCPDLYWYYVNRKVIPKDNIEKKRGLMELPEQVVRHWKTWYFSKPVPDAEKQKDVAFIIRLQKLVKQMSDAGIPLLISPGDEYFIIPGYSYLEELLLFKHVGVPDAKIVQAATINAAKALMDDAHIGSIKEGKYADILVLQKNPLEDITTLLQPRMVIVRNKFISASGELANVLQ
ncbi:hypothetical protein COR50_19195 [Chitinophaga caeni]|uniref:Amidohydrolase-related domain-containing protein n=1 Tax=Chitinophaga caeni TaxID=2029983 RepID=A0A291QYV9_9BACT|nr:amidohydrolase family protein [Chitinophaga caeni]ATL49127.1 hypothetical protein COR50_19195 [Chitinophaga caeni]